MFEYIKEIHPYFKLSMETICKAAATNNASFSLTLIRFQLKPVIVKFKFKYALDRCIHASASGSNDH
jgi:hypothetical protein